MTLTRRRFLKSSGTAASGLVLGFYVPTRGPQGRYVHAAEPFAPNAFIRISTDDVITIIVNQSEMGQGVYTSLPMLIAEELDADWKSIQIEPAPVAPEYAHFLWRMQLTGGSSSIISSWQPFRTAGATARALLVEAAAQEWGVDKSTLRTEAGHVIGGSKRASYGELAAKAATLPVPEPVPENVPLKNPKDFKLIGTNVKRIEGPSKVNGEAEFSMDVKRDGMLIAVVAHPPVCGGSVKKFDAAKAEAVPGVVKVKQIGSGIAVIAKDFWTARTARDQLEIEWDDGANAHLSTAALRTEYRALAQTEGTFAEDEGNAETAFREASKTLEAVYEVPYLAHAPMEPLNAVAHVREDGCDIWAGTQGQSIDQTIASHITGLKPEQIRVHTTLLGGGFGRRANVTSDFVADAVQVANGEGVPVKTIWTREDDIQCGYFRPMFVHKLEAGLDADGMPSAWHQRLVGQSIMEGTPFEDLTIKDGVDAASVEGATHMPYAIPNRRIEVHNAKRNLTVLWWRSVGHTHTGFVNESFLDEVAHAGGKDPYELRRELLKDQPRHRHVLELAAEKAGWGTPLPEGRARGIAMRKSFETFVAEVAEVSVEGGKVRVHKVVAAIDCGIAINPWNVVAQVESAIVFGLTAALHGELTLENGRVQQSNFHDYPVLRMDEMPEIEVHVVASDEPPTGVGEPGVPPIAPAVANALFTLTGKRVRSLPIRL
ncbi:MAG: xanthine dehydrogenase family protein molybdopterin-binding subunit [Acidobacteriota bacterium]|nr:MAG: xanthine dehydrogenase family protein molybdopterin-binding subunit [Acidobacteriota bacterium]